MPHQERTVISYCAQIGLLSKAQSAAAQRTFQPEKINKQWYFSDAARKVCANERKKIIAFHLLQQIVLKRHFMKGKRTRFHEILAILAYLHFLAAVQEGADDLHTA